MSYYYWYIDVKYLCNSHVSCHAELGQVQSGQLAYLHYKYRGISVSNPVFPVLSHSGVRPSKSLLLLVAESRRGHSGAGENIPNV